jgi:3-deoxy-D-manno-octulosonic acid kinase
MRIIAEQPRCCGGGVIIDARYTAQFEESMFTPRYWEEKQLVVGTAGGRGQVLFVNYEQEHWVLRHYHRGGAISLPLRDRYFWTGAEQTRPLLEWRLLAEMHAAGLPVPRPVAARYVRTGLFYRADLLTERIADAQPLSQVVAERIPDAGQWSAIGACIRRFHDAGIYHADLNAHNILLGENPGQVFILDFDRGRRRRPGRWKKSNLQRLNRSLHKIGLSLSAPEFEDRLWRKLVDGYGSA